MNWKRLDRKRHISVATKKTMEHLRSLPLRQPAPFVRPIRGTRKADRVCTDMGPCLNLTGLNVVQNSFITFQGSRLRWAATANVGLSPHKWMKPIFRCLATRARPSPGSQFTRWPHHHGLAADRRDSAFTKATKYRAETDLLCDISGLRCRDRSFLSDEYVVSVFRLLRNIDKHVPDYTDSHYIRQ
jgi:hypothetical protein